MKKICILIVSVICTISGYCQTSQQKVERQLQDTQRRVNAGKADAIISRNKNIFDTTFQSKSAEGSNNSTLKTNAKKKKHCCTKLKTKVALRAD